MSRNTRVRQAGLIVLTLALAGALVGGLYRLGLEARKGIGPRDRYSVRFADIECDPPPGCDRSLFLAEVRYISSLPETFQSLDPDLAARLTAAFTAHPRVAALEEVRVAPDGKVRVRLRHRLPVLRVHPDDGAERLVDGECVLLPVGTTADAVAELATPVPPPAIPAGQVWAEPIVKRAVELVDAHHPARLEKTSSGWKLTRPDGKTLSVEH